jgi:hypothetical protein
MSATVHSLPRVKPNISIRCNKAQTAYKIGKSKRKKTRHIQQTSPEPSRSAKIANRGTIRTWNNHPIQDRIADPDQPRS